MTHVEQAIFDIVFGVLFIALPQPFYAQRQAKRQAEWGMFGGDAERALRFSNAMSRVFGVICIIAGLWQAWQAIAS